MLRFLLFIVKLSLIIITFGIIGGILVIWHFSKQLPEYSQLDSYHPPCITRIYSADGILIEEYAKEKRIFVPIENIPKSIINAFIVAEDKNFYTHSGIDIFSLVRATFSNVFHIIDGSRFEGGSTITQQVVKNFLLTSERSLKRKIKEAILSYMISQVFSKDRILELYLNQLFLGRGYGVAAAALGYFHKSIEDLSIAESAFLASLPKAPSEYGAKKNYEKALARRNYIISRMYDAGYINEKEAKNSINEPLIILGPDKLHVLNANYYADQIRLEVINMFGEEYFYTAGLTIISCIDSKLQRSAANALRLGIKSYDKKGGYRGPLNNITISNWQQNLECFPKPSGLGNYKLAVVLNVETTRAKIGLDNNKISFIYLSDMGWTKKNLHSIKDLLKTGDIIIVEKAKTYYKLQQIPDVNGAIMVVEPYTGRVLAAEGGYDYNSSKFDRITQAKRQPGSLVKPFVYLAALEEGKKPNDIFLDSPIEINQGKGMPVWRPKNWDNKFMGMMTLREGLEKSRNIVTIRVAQTVGLKKISETFKRFGINDNLSTKINSIVLGSLETTLEKMTIAYSIIANKGRKVTPHYIEYIKDRKGNILYRRDYSDCIEHKKYYYDINTLPLLITNTSSDDIITDEATNYQIISILIGAIERGTGQAAKNIHKIIAGKTGTSNDGRDTWFVGFTPRIVVGTYIGYDIPRSLGKNATGANIALPVFINFMNNSYKHIESVNFEIPKSINLISINSNTGKPSKEKGSIMEAFKVNEYDKELENLETQGYTKVPDNNLKERESENLIPLISIDNTLDEIY